MAWVCLEDRGEVFSSGIGGANGEVAGVFGIARVTGGKGAFPWVEGACAFSSALPSCNIVSKMRRVHFRRECFVSDEGELFVARSGQFIGRITKLFAPTGDEVRAMLAEVRKKSGLTTAVLAATLGVPLITARRWLDGSRTPSGAAKRLIWLLFTTQHSPELLSDARAWQEWTGSRFPLPTVENEDNGLADGPANQNQQCRSD